MKNQFKIIDVSEALVLEDVKEGWEYSWREFGIIPDKNDIENLIKTYSYINKLRNFELNTNLDCMVQRNFDDLEFLTSSKLNDRLFYTLKANNLEEVIESYDFIHNIIFEEFEKENNLPKGLLSRGMNYKIETVFKSEDIYTLELIFSNKNF